MGDRGHLTVHDFWGTDDLASIGRANTLVSQADPEDGNSLGKLADDGAGNARLLRGAGAWRNNNFFRCEALYLIEGNLIV